MARLGETNSNDNVASTGETLITPDPDPLVPLAAGGNFFRWTATGNQTATTSGTPTAGRLVILKIINDATLPRVITFGTGFISSGILTGIISKASIVLFVGDGSNLYEMGRTVGI